MGLKEIRSYVARNGKNYFLDWFHSLRDKKTVTILENRLRRLSVGNIGNIRSLGRGLWELKIDFGPGFRVYFGVADETLILLVVGGDKSTQHKDILRANELWQEYEEDRCI